MHLLKFFKSHYFDWILLFLFAFTLRIIGVNYGLPFEHHPDDEGIFGFVDQAIDSGKILNPGVYSYGGIHYYFLTFTSLLARTFINTSYIREYEILFTRVAMVLIVSVSVVLLYEIARKLVKDRFAAFFTAAFAAVSVVSVMFSRFTTVDGLIILFVMITVLVSIAYFEKGKTKTLFWMFALAGLTVSLKISYTLFLLYPVFVYSLKKKFRFNIKKDFLIFSKLLFISILFFIIGNIFEVFHFTTWVGRNIYFYKTYSSPEYFYFKLVKPNYFEHLFSIVKLIFADYFIITKNTVWIALGTLLLFIWKGYNFYKSNKNKFFLAILCPALFILFAASRQIFLIRTVFPAAPLLLIVLLYPLRLQKIHQVAYKFVVLVLFLLVFAGTINALADLQKKDAEKIVTNFINTNKGIFAVPYSFSFPSIEYAHYGVDERLNLFKHNFFNTNRDKLIFYKKEDDLINTFSKTDYVVLSQQMFQSIDYRKSNELRLEPVYDFVDISKDAEIENVLRQLDFYPVTEVETSDYEMIAQYDPASLSKKKFTVYKKGNKLEK